MTRRVGRDRERIRRSLTFWLRPAFVLRVLTRFQRVVGFDRAVALASSAFTALIPLAIITSAILPHTDAKDAANTIINRYGLTGGGAEAVRDLLSPAGGTGTDVSVIGAVLLVFAALSFSRAVQRLFEQTWELKPLSVRNTANDLIWIAGAVCYVAFSWWMRDLLDHGRVQIASNLAVLPVSAIFLAWSGRALSARRIELGDLTPFAIVGSVLLGIYLIGAAVYVPHLFSTSASRYGVIGAVLAMISTLFGMMVVIVASAAVGREVSEELGRIRRGERPPEDEVRREWDALVLELRSHWATLRGQLNRRR
ncbi:MAG: YihY/virulence factor BrkB family protein [Solirubrobacterales bacterium]|nr:YihY/virulence factor BrkB family protein [Solirubrobacterales bacterium]